MKTDIEKNNLNGDIKTIRQSCHQVLEESGTIKDGEIVDCRHGNYYLEFDVKGNYIKTTKYSSKGEIEEYIVFEYDNEGNHKPTGSSQVDESLNWKIIDDNDKDGNVTERKWYMPDGSLWKRCEYKYDDRGKKKEEWFYNPDNSFLWKSIYQYDHHGNIIKKDTYDNFGLTESNMFEYKYDANDNWIQMTEYVDDTPVYIVHRRIEYF